MISVGSLLGLIIGTVLGLTGAGGGVLAVPALVFGLGMDMRDAAPAALLAVGAAAALGAVQGLRLGIVRYKAAFVLAAAGALAAPLGLQVAHGVSPRWLNLAFVAVMLMVACRTFIASRGAHTDGDLIRAQAKVCRVSRDTGRFIWNLRTAATLGSIGIVSGFVTGMLGVGGGFIIVPALARFSELRIHSIVATSLMVIALLSTVTVFVAWRQGPSLTAATWSFVVATLVGMLGGRLMASKVPGRTLQQGFSIICVAVAVLMLLGDVA